MNGGKLRSFLASAVVAAMVGLPVVAAADTVSVDCAIESLQAAVDGAAPASTIVVHGTCHGPVTLSKDVTLKGVAPATLDADQTGPAITVAGTHEVHLRSLVVTGGLAVRGAGIDMPAGGTLTLDHVTVRDNVALDDGQGVAAGGGIFAGGVAVTIRNSSLLRNRAIASSGGIATEFARGGAIDVEDGALTIAGSSVDDNRAVTRSDGFCTSAGGAIFVVRAPVAISASHFDGNVASARAANITNVEGGAILFQTQGGQPFSIDDSSFTSNLVFVSLESPDPAVGFGGALTIDANSAVDVTGTRFRDNRILANGQAAFGQGGAIRAAGDQLTMHLASSDVVGSVVDARGTVGAARSFGSGMALLSGIVTVDLSTVASNSATAHAGGGTATALGGGVAELGPVALTVRRSTVAANLAGASSDASAAVARGGGIHTESGGVLDLRTSTLNANRATASSSSGSPSALGGGLDLTSAGHSDEVLNSTITGNRASSTGPNAASAGGGAAVADAALVVHLATIARNVATASGSGSSAAGGGIEVQAGMTRLRGTILAVDTATTGPSCAGAVATDGFNLFGPTAGCTLTLAATDRADVAPKLGKLAANGGPTDTLALLVGSPALNRIGVTPCHEMAATDQRLVARPQGTKCDVGAFERNA